MNFLYPGFLFALLAVAIPVVIHLFNFRRFKKVYFSNVQFLKEVQEQHSSREKLKNLLVLLCRVLAVAFLVLAFARPYFSENAKQDPSLQRVVNIYIDNSYSMETVNKEGSLLDEARRKAKELVGAYGLNDRFRLITNDFEGRHQRLLGREEFLQMLDGIKISAASRSMQQVLNRIESDLDAGKSQVAYLISDFQKSFINGKAADGAPDVAALPSLRTSGALQYNLVKLNANSQPNIAVDSIWILSPVHKPGGQERFVVRLKNYGEEDAAGVPLKLTVNNQQKAAGTVKVPAGKSVTDTLAFGGLSAGWQKAVVSIRDFPLTFDDVLNFSFEVRKVLNVLNISGDASNKYISTLFAADSYFKLTEMPESNIRYTDFPGYSLIVLSGLKNPSSGLAQELRSFLLHGGAVVIFPDLGSGITIYGPFLAAMQLPAIEQLVDGQPVASSIDFKNKLFRDVFDQVPKNIDLPVASRYFNYVNRSSSGRESILQLPLDRSLFARYPAGTGSVYLSAVSLDLKDGNLPRHPVFVPLLYRIAFSSVREQPLYYTAGRSDLIETQKISMLRNESLKLVSGSFEVIPELRQTPGSTLLYIADQAKQPGFYELKKTDSLLMVTAFNDGRTESDMHYAAGNELKGLLGNNMAKVFNSKKDALSLNMEVKNNSTELWKLCLILTVVFLTAEIILIRFFNQTKKIQGA